MTMRIARTLGWLSLFAGVATYLATRAAMQKRDEHERKEVDDSTRWETDGGATTAGPQVPGATF
jgi:hypothetical protein